MKLLKFRKRRETEQKEPREPDPVVLAPGDSREIYGIIFTNATGEPMQFKAYENRVVVLCKPMEDEEDGKEEGFKEG